MRDRSRWTDSLSKRCDPCAGIWRSTSEGAIHIVERPSQAAKRPHMVGALPEPKMRTRKRKNLPPTDVAVKRGSEGRTGI